MSDQIWPLYVELFTIGSLWVAGHCAGMCGPLILAFRFGARPDGTVSWVRSYAQFGAYHAGRAIGLGLLGFAIGWLGSRFARQFQAAMPWATLAVAAVLLALAAYERGWLRLPATGIPSPLAALARRSQAALGRCSLAAPLLLGLGLAYLPCGITFWVISLAARSADPLHGAALLALLELMTVPVLAVVNALPAWASRWRFAAYRWLVPAGLAVSAGLLIWRAIQQIQAGSGMGACCT